MLERLFGRGRGGQEQTGMQTEQQQKRAQAEAEQRKKAAAQVDPNVLDMLNRPDGPKGPASKEDKLIALADQVSKEINGEVPLPQESQPVKTQTLEEIAQAKNETSNVPGQTQERVVQDEPGFIKLQEPTKAQKEAQQQRTLEQMMGDFETGLVQSGNYSKEEARKIRSIYNQDIIAGLAQNEQLRKYIDIYKQVPNAKFREKFLPTFMKSLVTLGISGIIPVMSGRLTYLIPSFLFSAVSFITNMNQADKADFKDGISKKDTFARKGEVTQIQIDQVLKSVDDQLVKQGAVPPELLQRAAYAIDMQNTELANFLNSQLDVRTIKKIRKLAGDEVPGQGQKKTQQNQQTQQPAQRTKQTSVNLSYKSTSGTPAKKAA